MMIMMMWSLQTIFSMNYAALVWGNKEHFSNREFFVRNEEMHSEYK
jgi:hypothetical protein